MKSKSSGLPVRRAETRSRLQPPRMSEADLRLIDMTASDIRAILVDVVAEHLERLSPASQRPERPGVDWLSNKEARATLGVSKTTLARWRESGRLRFSKVGRLVFYHSDDLEALLNEARTGPEAGPSASADGAAPSLPA